MKVYLKNHVLITGTEDPSYRTHYADDERYEYDDNIDELFNLAEHLITISHSRTKSIRAVISQITIIELNINIYFPGIMM
jgi:hypothetical protein